MFLFCSLLDSNFQLFFIAYCQSFPRAFLVSIVTIQHHLITFLYLLLASHPASPSSRKSGGRIKQYIFDYSTILFQHFYQHFISRCFFFSSTCLSFVYCCKLSAKKLSHICCNFTSKRFRLICIMNNANAFQFSRQIFLFSCVNIFLLLLPYFFSQVTNLQHLLSRQQFGKNCIRQFAFIYCPIWLTKNTYLHLPELMTQPATYLHQIGAKPASAFCFLSASAFCCPLQANILFAKCCLISIILLSSGNY